MKQQPGYPLPGGGLGSDDIVCQLVFLPNRPEYWQALVSSLHYLATWRAWERDTDKRGKDAATNWSQANELTMECWRMACLQELQDNVAAILAIMELPPTCCDETDITNGDRYTDRVEDGVGDVPQNVIDSGYATDTSDWAGFDDYKCMISHVIVDQLNARLLEMAPYITGYGLLIGGVGLLATIVTTLFTGGLTAIAFGLIAATGSTALLYQGLVSGDWAELLAGDVVDNHDELACAVYNSDGDDGALVALNDKIDELFSIPEALVLKNMNLGPTLKALYSGRFDEQDMAETLLDAGYDVGDFSCYCDEIDVGDWILYDDPDLDIYRYEAPPDCQNYGWNRYQRWIHENPNGASGTYTVQGYFLLTGDLILNSGCTSTGQMKLSIWADSDHTNPPSLPGSPNWRTQFINWTDYPGGLGISRRYDWEETWTFTNPRYILIGRRVDARYGEIDINAKLVITSIQVT